jgi:hypothetical protein
MTCDYRSKCPNGKEKDIAGQRFGRLLAIKRDGFYFHIPSWVFKCDCGVVKSLPKYTVVNGITQSCGCWQKELLGMRSRTHGKTSSRVYTAWEHMVARCNNPNHANYKNYGGRGITVSPEWMTFENFYSDMGEKPLNLTLERIDNNKGYSKGNCMWATYAAQGRNTRRTKLTKHEVGRIREFWDVGIKQTELADLFNVSKPHISRICTNQKWRKA